MLDDTADNKKEEGAPPWVMTFADLMSLLLSFFVLLLSFSEMEAQKFKQIAGSMREAFGVQQRVKVKESPKGTSFIAREFSPGRPTPTAINEVRQHTIDDFQRYLNVPNEDTDRIEADAQRVRQRDENFLPRGEGQARGHRSGEAGGDARGAREGKTGTGTAPEGEAGGIEPGVLEEYQRIRDALKDEIDRGLIEVLAAGKKVIIRIREKGSFPSGNADLIEPFYPVILKMVDVLEQSDGHFVIAGHTDDRPINTPRYRSNWELSAARAVSVAHELMALSTLPPERFRVEGHADTRPVADNATPEGRARNRRVEVIIVKGRDSEAPPVSVWESSQGAPAAPAGSPPAATTEEHTAHVDAQP